LQASCGSDCKASDRLAPQSWSQPRHSPLPPVLKIASISSSVLPLVSCSAQQARLRPQLWSGHALVRQPCATLHWCVKCQIHVLAFPMQQTQSTSSSTYTQSRHALDILVDMCTIHRGQLLVVPQASQYVQRLRACCRGLQGAARSCRRHMSSIPASRRFMV